MTRNELCQKSHGETTCSYAAQNRFCQFTDSCLQDLLSYFVNGGLLIAQRMASTAYMGSFHFKPSTNTISELFCLNANSFPKSPLISAMLGISALFRFWLFGSAFSTIYIIAGSVSGLIKGFKILYYSLDDCLVFTGSELDIGQLIRSVFVTILALIFLGMQKYRLAVLLPENAVHNRCVVSSFLRK